MSQDDLHSSGVKESLRGLFVTGVTLLQNRFELFLVEVEEQKARLVRLLIFGAVAIMLINAAILSLGATIVVLVGEDSRIKALIALTLLYAAAAGGSLLLLRKELKCSTAFDDTISELKKDREWLVSKK